MIYENLAKIVEDIRKAVFGYEVREKIALGIEEIGKVSKLHDSEVNKVVENNLKEMKRLYDLQDLDIANLDKMCTDVIKQITDNLGGENLNIAEIVEARGHYETLGKRIDVIEENPYDKEIGGKIDTNLTILDEEDEVEGTINNKGITIGNISVANLKTNDIFQTQLPINITVDCGVEGNLIKLSIKEFISRYGAKDGTLTDLIPAHTEQKEIIVYKSIQGAIDSLGKYALGDIIITIMSGVYDEDITIDGFTGRGGMLRLSPRAGVVLNGSIHYYNNTLPMYLYGDGKDRTSINHTGRGQAPIYLNNTNFIAIDGIRVSGIPDKTNYLIQITRFGYARVYGLDLSNSKIATLYVDDGASILATGCVGSNNKGESVKVGNGGNAMLGGTCAMATKTYTEPPYGIIKATNLTMAESGQGSGGGTGGVETELLTIPTSTAKSYRAVDGWHTNGVYQGKYSSKNSDNYRYVGVLTYADRTISNIKSGTIQIVRKSTAGSSFTVDVFLGGTTSNGTGSTPAITKNYGKLCVINKGQTLQVNIPVQALKDLFENKSIKSLVIGGSLDSNSVKNYACMELNTGTLKVIRVK